MSANIAIALGGADRLIRQIKLADPKTRARVVAVIQKNTKAVEAGALTRAPSKSGIMRSTIRDEYSPDGLVGFVKVGRGKLPRRSKATTAAGVRRFAKIKKQRKLGPGAYAPVVERGDPRTNRKPHPFLQPTFQAQKPTVMSDLTSAMNDSVNEIA